MSQKKLSRLEFLRLSALGVAGVVLNACTKKDEATVVVTKTQVKTTEPKVTAATPTPIPNIVPTATSVSSLPPKPTTTITSFETSTSVPALPTETTFTDIEISPSETPSLVWSSQASSFATADGKIFIQSGDNQIQAFDIKTGKTIWVVNASGKIVWADPNIVYTRPSEFRVDALDANTGEFRWRNLSQ